VKRIYPRSPSASRHLSRNPIASFLSSLPQEGVLEEVQLTIARVLEFFPEVSSRQALYALRALQKHGASTSQPRFAGGQFSPKIWSLLVTNRTSDMTAKYDVSASKQASDMTAKYDALETGSHVVTVENTPMLTSDMTAKYDINLEVDKQPNCEAQQIGTVEREQRVCGPATVSKSNFLPPRTPPTMGSLSQDSPLSSQKIYKKCGEDVMLSSSHPSSPPAAAPQGAQAGTSPVFLGGCTPEPRSETEDYPSVRQVSKKPNAFMLLREAGIKAGEYDPTKPTDGADWRHKFPKASPTSPGSHLASNPSHVAGGTPSEEVPRKAPFVKKALSLHEYLGAPQPAQMLLSPTERVEREARVQHCHRNLLQARSEGLLPPPIWDALPTLSLPQPKLLPSTMALEGQVERLLRAYRGVSYRRFKKWPKERFAAKQALKSATYGPLLTQAAAALVECQIPPCAWVDWAVHQWVEKKFKGNFEWAKMPPMQWLFAPQMILPMRHSFRDAYRTPYEQRYAGPIEQDLVALSMAQERELSSFPTVEALVAFWRNSPLGKRWDALLAAAQLEQDQQQQVWGRQLALGEWIDEWR